MEKEIKEIKINDIITKLTEDVAEKRSKILDDFMRAYISERWEDYSGKKGIKIGRLELVEKRNGMETTWFFRLKKGRLKN